MGKLKIGDKEMTRKRGKSKKMKESTNGMMQTNLCSKIIWGREFDLSVYYDCYGDEEILPEQRSAFEMVLKNEDLLDKAKDYVEQYNTEHLAEEHENEQKDNIFNYIKPDYFYVKREDAPRVALMCKYRYDPEHGLAIVFDAEGKIQVGIQDIIL